MRHRRPRRAPTASASSAVPAPPIAPDAAPITPLQAIRAITWAADMDPDEIFWSIRRAPEIDLASKWPELSAAQVEAMQRRCARMTRNRLREWNRADGDSAPTWADVRALISGLHLILE